MWSIQKRVTVLLVVAVMLKVVLTKNDKFRFIAKTVENCDDPGLTMKMKDLETSYKKKNTVLVIKIKVDISEDTEVKEYGIVVFQEGNPPKILVSLQANDFCEKLKEGKTVYLEPGFTSGQLPRACTIEKGTYPLDAEVDVVFDKGDNPDSAKGRYNYNYTFGNGDKNVFCATGYGDLKVE